MTSRSLTLPSRFYLSFVVLFLLLAAAPLCLYSAEDLPPGKTFLQFSSPPFLFLYAPEDLPLLKHLLPLAHQSYERLKAFTGNEPDPPIIVVLISDHDIANGLTTPLPRNTIRLYTSEPRQPSLFMGREEWYALLLTHELAHVFHLDWTEFPSSLTRILLGRTLFPLGAGGGPSSLLALPFCTGFPNLFLPDTLTEGYATLAESSLVKGGRLDSPLGRLYLRNLARENALPLLGGAVGFRRLFPQGDTPYLLGGSFQRSLTEPRGRTLTLFYENQARGLTPYCYGIPFLCSTGMCVEGAWTSWRRKEMLAARRSFRKLENPSPYLQHTRGYPSLRSLFFSKETGRLLATVNDGIFHEAFGFFDEGFRFHPLGERHGGEGLSYRKGIFAYDENAYREDTVIGSYVRLLLPSRETRSLGPHYFEPDLHEQRWVSVRRQGNTYCLELRSLDNNKLIQEHCAPPFSIIHHPRFSPDGSRIVWVQENPGTRSDLYLWDLVAHKVTPILATTEDEWNPRFSGKGTGIYFLRNDEEGLPQLHYLDLGTSLFYPLTRVPIGMVNYGVDEEGRRIYFTSPGKEGFALYSTLLPLEIKGKESHAEVTSQAPSPPSPPTPSALPGEPYHPLPWLRPAGATPLLFWGSGFAGAGVNLLGAEPLGNLSLSLTSFFLYRPRPLFFGFLSFTYDEGQWLFPIEGVVQPETLGGTSSGIVYTLGVGVNRRFREIHLLQDLLLRAAGELHPGKDLSAFLLSTRYDLDARRTPLYAVERSGLFLRLSGDQAFLTQRGERLPDSHGIVQLLYAPILLALSPQHPLQFNLLFSAAGHSHLRSPLRYLLLPPLGISPAPRTLFSRAAPPGGVQNLDSLFTGELELLTPLLWVNEGLFSLPLYLDGIHLRGYLAGASWKGTGGPGESLFLGGELGFDFITLFTTFFPLRIGYRYSPLLKTREFYLTLSTSDSLVLPALKQSTTW